MLQKLAHTSIHVKDIAMSKNFYGNILGLNHLRDVENESIKFSFFEIGDTQIELIELKHEEYKKRSIGPVDHIAFFTDNLQKEIDRLKKHEVSFLMEETKETLEFKLIFLEGPDGEKIELMEKIK